MTSPPDDGAGDSAIHVAPPLFADVRSVSYFTIIPDSPCDNYTPEWHTGNIYDLPHSPAQLLRLPCAPARNGSTTTYHIFASGDYEIRLFGDPVDIEGQEMPIQRLKLHFEFEDMDGGPVILEPQTDIVPDFVDGWALAANGALGIGVKAINGWWRVTNVTASDPVSSRSGVNYKSNCITGTLAKPRISYISAEPISVQSYTDTITTGCAILRRLYFCSNHTRGSKSTSSGENDPEHSYFE